MLNKASPPFAEVSDKEVLELIREGRPLEDILKELISLRNWKQEQIQSQEQDSQRLELLISRLCVSVFIQPISTLAETQQITS